MEKEMNSLDELLSEMKQVFELQERTIKAQSELIQVQKEESEGLREILHKFLDKLSESDE